MKTIITIFLTLILNCSILLSQDFPDSIQWTSVGLGGGGGMFSPAISPHNDSLMFVSCDMSGVYRSTNAGSSWEMLNYRQLSSSINVAPVFHPTDPNIIWDDSRRVLMQSTDAGKSWNKVWDMPGNPSAFQVVYVNNLYQGLFIALGESGLYYMSEDTEFTKVEDIHEAFYIDGKIIASSSNVWRFKYLQSGTLNFEEINTPEMMDNPEAIIDIAQSSENIFLLEETKLWMTGDNGATWIVVARYENYERGYFRFVKVSNNNIWISTRGGYYQPTVLFSNDDGLIYDFQPTFFCNDSWDDSSNLENGWLSLDFNCGWGGPAIGFNISKTNPEQALWTDFGRTLYTSNTGETWEALYTTYADDGDREAGKLWQSRGLEVTTSWDLFVSPGNNNFVNIAYTDIGGAYSSDAGVKWRSTQGGGIPGEWFNTTYDFEYDEENEILWAAFSGKHDIPSGWSSNFWYNEGNGGVAYSSDAGVNWTALTNNGLINKPVTSVAIDYTSPIDNRRLYASVWSNGVWRSNDGGSTWERSSEGLDCGDGTNTNDGPNTHVVEVQVHPNGTVFALKTKYLRDGSIIKNDAGLWRSTNQGDSWEFISSYVADSPPNNSIDTEGEHSWADAISFLLDEDDINHIYVGAQNANNGKVQGGLYETTDGGENWIRIYQTYAAHRLTKSKYFANRLYLATVGEGLLISTNNGESWTEAENFPFIHPTRITEDPSDSNLIWVNTYGGGVWKGEFIDNISSVIELPNKSDFEINIYPNPFSSELNIEASGCNYIEIYDVFGRRVAKQAGDRFIFHPDRINNSTFFIRAVFDKTSIIKPAILMR